MYHSFIILVCETELLIFAFILQTSNLIYKYLLSTYYWPDVLLQVGYVLLGDIHCPSPVALRKISMLPS